VTNLEDIPNVGRATAEDFIAIGIESPEQLAGQDPFELYQQLNRVTGTRQDPCVLDVFMAAVAFMEGGPAQPWWAFTEKRKKLLRERKD